MSQPLFGRFSHSWSALALAVTLALSGCNPATNAPATPQSTATPATANAAQPAAAWWDNAVFYQIWPRSFADSDADGAGDFVGIEQKLPYLQDLGVNALWLTPVFEAPSYHGYDFTEFYQVEKDYGTMAQFEHMVAAANAKHIRVILDLVINHISDQHDWFKRSAAGEAPYKDYFIWRDSLPTEGWGPAWDASKVDPKAVWHYNETRKAWYYGAFGASQPDLNLTHPDVVAEMKKMAKFWLDKGVAGFRLDAVRYAIENGPGQQADTAETIQYWQDFSSYVRSIKPDAMLVGEAWADLPVSAKYYAGGKGLDSGFDFDFGYKIMSLLQSQAGVKAEFGTMDNQSKDTHQDPASVLMANMQQRNASGAPQGYFSPFLTNHDQPRLGFQLSGDLGKAKLAAAMLFSSPGTPYVYYGEEIGLTQASDAEHIQRRAPMLWSQDKQAGFTTSDTAWVQKTDLFPPQQDASWWTPFLTTQLAAHRTVADMQQDKSSLWQLYKLLIGLKQSHAEFGVAGSYKAEMVSDGKLLQISRELDGKKTVMLLNLSENAAPVPAEFANTTALKTMWIEPNSTATELAAGQLRIWSY